MSEVQAGSATFSDAELVEVGGATQARVRTGGQPSWLIRRAIGVFLTMAVLVAPQGARADLLEDRWDLVARCNSGDQAAELTPLLWDETSFDNLHILALSDDCVSHLAKTFGSDAIRTVFMYGRPELLAGNVADRELAERMLLAVYYGDRLSFRQSEGLPALLRQMHADGVIDSDEFDLLWAFSVSARAGFGVFDPETEEMPPDLLDYLPDTEESHALLVDLCAANDLCSSEDDSSLEQSFCAFGQPLAEKGLFLRDPERFQALFDGCGFDVGQIGGVLQYLTIYGVLDGFCSDTQSVAAQHNPLSAAKRCKELSKDGSERWPTRGGTVVSALYIGVLAQDEGFAKVRHDYSEMVALLSLTAALDRFAQEAGLEVHDE